MQQPREWKHYLGLFGVIAASIILYFLLLRFDQFSGIIDTIFNALSPVVTGVAFSYLLRPLARRLELWLRCRSIRISPYARAISVMVTILTALAVISIFFMVIIPQITESVRTFISVAPAQLRALLRQLEEYTQANSEIAANFERVVTSVQDYITNWLKTDMLGSLGKLVGNAMAFLTGLVSLIISVVVTAYVLTGWEHYVAQLKKLFLALSHNDTFNGAVFETIKQMNQIFSGFISGKLLDSLIVGIICFIFMTVGGMPYGVLISVIIGVTNIIPMFGPFIGAIPSAFLILLVSPVRCLVFIIFILVLQQVDGNIIGPRILGNSTGLSPLYVTIGILLFSKLFGFIGMLIGVPLFATIYHLVKRLAEAELQRRHLSINTEDYTSKNKP